MFLALTALVFLALKKSSKHENLSSALQITFHFMRSKYLSCTWALLLKLHLATFSHWEAFQHPWPWILFICLVALNTSISVLRSSKPVILCIEALTWLALQKSSNTSKSVFYIANNISFHEKETSFMYLSLTLKIAFSNFLSLRKKLFSILGLGFSSFA